MANYVRDYNVNGITFTDLNDGRYVVHFLEFLNQKEKDEMWEKYRNSMRGAILYEYDFAIAKAKKIGGRKYRAKWYGGGIVIDIDQRTLEEVANEIITLRG